MSQSSQTSSIPFELTEYQDPLFVDDLTAVDQLYFGDHSDSDSDLSDSDEINFESDISSDEVDVDVEPSSHDNLEYISQAKFRNDTCGCSEYYDGKPCSLVVDFDSMIEFRENCQEMSREELDIVIKSQLFAHRNSGANTDSKRHKSRQRVRSHQLYYFRGQKICRQTFCFVHAVSHKKLQAIASSLDKDGLKPRVHGLSRRNPPNSLTYTDRDRLQTFICKYANENALPLPGRLPNFKTSTVLLLPSDKTMADIHVIYEASALESGYRSVSLRTFRRIWSELCPHITLAKPTTDLCQKCQVYANKLGTMGGRFTEEEKSVLLENYKNHLKNVQEQRDYYRQQSLISKQLYETLPPELREGGNVPCSVEGDYHYSWDFAQQIHYPHHSQQVGPIFFRTPRKCSVFGVCSEGAGKQTFYLLDEGECAGKGANEVTSMAHHYLIYFGMGEQHAKIHFDNCCGQNKNNVVLWYALWRVLTGLHMTIEYSMMVAGHTKFSPDWHFGVWKVKWRNTNAETLQDIANSVKASSRSGHNIPQLVADPEKPVQFFQWKTFLSRFFKPLKHLTKYHHFLVSADEPGVVTCRETASSQEVKFSLMKRRPTTADGLPEVLTGPGLDPARQWYLYEHIRQFFNHEEAKDSVCPKPLVPKKEVRFNDSNSCEGIVKSTSSKRKDILLN